MFQTVNEDCIAALVDNFYGQVRHDQLLGPIFSAAIGSDWTLHLERMNAFWHPCSWPRERTREIR